MAIFWHCGTFWWGSSLKATGALTCKHTGDTYFDENGLGQKDAHLLSTMGFTDDANAIREVMKPFG